MSESGFTVFVAFACGSAKAEQSKPDPCSRLLRAATDEAIALRKQRNAAISATKNPSAKFESGTSADEKRRRCRDLMRGLRKKRCRCRAEPRKVRATSAKTLRGSSAGKPATRNVPANCCGKRKHKCTCFDGGRGLEIARSLRRRKLDHIMPAIAQSRIQTWRDTRDMPGYMRQIGWEDSMRYSWLFPIAFIWRHFSNEEFWTALQKQKAVLQNQRPNFACMENTMRAFAAKGVSYHGGLFYSGSSLTQYRFPSAAKPADWTDCPKSMDFIAREVLALRIVWHVAETFRSEYDALQSKPTRQCWKACTEAFLKAIRNHTKGIFGDYSMKITLDGVLLPQPRLEHAVSWWPMHCPAYKIALPELYANCTTSRQDLFLAACHFHAATKKSFPRFLLRDSLAQTCWIKRGVTGVTGSCLYCCI